MDSRRWVQRARRGSGVAAVAALAVVLGACVQDLGLPPGYLDGYAVDVTDDGLVVANASSEPVPGRYVDWAFVREREGAWRPVGDPAAGDWSSLVAAGVDDRGTIVGTAWVDPNLPFSTVAVTWDEAGGLRPFPGLPGDWRLSVAAGISRNGEYVIGSGERGSEGEVQFVLHRPTGRVTALPLLAGLPFATVSDVNDAGTVVGVASGHDVPDRAVVWEPPYAAAVALPPVPGPDASTRARAIDADGTIVGTQGDVFGQAFGVRWSPGPHRLPSPLGLFLPEDIDGGAVVGQSWDDASQAQWWPPGAAAPENLGRIDGGTSAALAIRGDEMVGRATPGPTGTSHPARFAPNP